MSNTRTQTLVAEPRSTGAVHEPTTRGSDDTQGLVNSSVLEVPLSFWDSLDGRYQLMAAAWGSFVICNMDKVNMSVAIIPMAMDVNQMLVPPILISGKG